MKENSGLNAQLRADFELLLLENYRRTGEEVRYWATRFLGAVKRRGGVAQAKQMLAPRNLAQRAGLDRLIEANRPELTVEHAVLRPRFAALFTNEERQIARERLREFGTKARAAKKSHDPLYPEALPFGGQYTEGARKWIAVNAYERSVAARNKCVKHHGYRCTACDLLLEDVYGKRGRHFVHVHHLKPRALTRAAYVIDPISDLRPVCPNCHAMLHRGKSVLSIEQLRRLLLRNKKYADKSLR